MQLKIQPKISLGYTNFNFPVWGYCGKPKPTYLGLYSGKPKPAHAHLGHHCAKLYCRLRPVKV